MYMYVYVQTHSLAHTRVCTLWICPSYASRPRHFLSVCMYVFMHLCIHVNVRIRTHTHTHVHLVHLSQLRLEAPALFVRMHVCVHVYTYVFICTYKYTHSHTHVCTLCICPSCASKPLHFLCKCSSVPSMSESVLKCVSCTSSRADCAPFILSARCICACVCVVCVCVCLCVGVEVCVMHELPKRWFCDLRLACNV